MTLRLTLFSVLVLVAGGLAIIGLESPVITAAQKKGITIRTENYPRPPYSGATYFIYERDGEVICTKLEVCNKFDECSTEYKKGSYKEDVDVETGDPYGTTAAVLIPNSKLKKHVCLTKFKLL